MVFEIRKETIDQIKGIYEPSHPGVISIRDVLPEDLRKAVLEEIIGHNYLFTEAPRKYLNAEQEMLHFYLGEADPEKINMFLPAVAALKEGYGLIRRELAMVLGYQKTKQSIAVQVYPKEGKGITFHQDESKNRNVIGIFAIEGEVDLWVYKSRDRMSPQIIETPSGSLTLMRAPRHDDEIYLRPFHEVKGIKSETTRVVFREQKF